MKTIILLLCALVIAVNGNGIQWERYNLEKEKIQSYDMDNQNGCLGLKAIYPKKTLTHLICCEPDAFKANASFTGFTKDGNVDVVDKLNLQFPILIKGHHPCGRGLLEYPRQ